MSAGVGEARVPHRPRVARPTAPRGPRRVSGPARPKAVPRTARAQAAALPAPGLPVAVQRALDALRRLPDARWLDRMLRGQTWVAVIGVALIGIVAMQVSLLKLNAGIGQSVEKTATLERQNADLRESVSQLSSEERIQLKAAGMGLVLPPAGEVRYVTVRPGEDPGRAAKVMISPAPESADAATTTSALTATDPAAEATTPTDAATDPAATTATATATATAPQTGADPAASTTSTPAAATTAATPATGATTAPTTATPTATQPTTTP